jgi:hypothetical protein
MFIYHILDIFFLVFHTSLIIFNLFGWIWRKTRRINLLTLFLTGLSWSLIGIIVGVPGYCPFTDWHFSILEKLGHADLPSSYVKYLADRITGLSFNPGSIDKITLYCFLAALIISIIVNATDIIRRKRVLKRVNSQVKL